MSEHRSKLGSDKLTYHLATRFALVVRLYQASRLPHRIDRIWRPLAQPINEYIHRHLQTQDLLPSARSPLSSGKMLFQPVVHVHRNSATLVSRRDESRGRLTWNRLLLLETSFKSNVCIRPSALATITVLCNRG